MKIPESVKNELKKPLGRLVGLEELAKIGNGKRIISVGDICTINLISIGITPHLAVFDYFYMRHELEQERIEILQKKFPNQKKYTNPTGTLSEQIISDAKQLVKDGGAVLIYGEEDLTALAFILAASKDEIVVYGQPNEGIVAVEPDEKIKKRIKKLLAIAAL